MALRITLGEPLWRELGVHEVLIEFEPGQILPLSDLPARIGLTGWTTEGLLAAVNDRLVPAGDAQTLMLHDGDHVVLQLMLAGG